MAEKGWKALVTGGTGLVGQELLQFLQQDDRYSKVYHLNRKKDKAEEKIQHIKVDMDHLLEAEIGDVDHVFCCLGTTIKTAGSKEAFRRVDVDYVTLTGRLGMNHGATRMALVSSIGANIKSSFFYLRCKGEVEQALMQMGYEHLLIARPSALEGDRAEKRTGERFALTAMKVLGPMMVGPLSKQRPVHVKQVASMMAQKLPVITEAVRVVEANEIREY